MKKTVSGAEALTMLERVVERHGFDTRYDERDGEYYEVEHGCRYMMEDGTPACLVGAVFIEELGLTPNIIDFFNVGTGVESATRYLADYVDFEEDAISVLDAAQSAQDGGSTWGYALEKAEARLLGDEDDDL